MGFELDRLMRQFGVSTPSLNYSGTGVPIDPGTRPVATDTLTGTALTDAQANYDNLLAKYNLDKANYPADQALYNTYRTEYQNRLLGTPQYMQAQFQTGNEPKSAGYQWATNPNIDPATGSGMGIKQFNQNIQNWASSNPTANTAAINAYADKYGLNAQDIYNATNNRWGNTLDVPKYGTLTPDLNLPLACGVGMKPNADGTACIPDTSSVLVCGVGMKPNADGTACVPITTGGGGGLVCGVGMTPNADGTACVPITTTELTCGVGMKPNADGTACIPDTVDTLKCEAGFQPNAAGTACVPIPDDTLKCEAGFQPNADGTACVPIPDETLKCEAGFQPNADGTACVPIPVETLKCEAGFQPNADGTACVPIPDDTLKCGAGMMPNADGTACIPIPDETLKCGAGMMPNADGTACIPIPDDTLKCGAGMTPNADGTACVPIIDTPAACGVGMVRNAQGECVPFVEDKLKCGAGMTPNADGTACVPIVDTPTTLVCGVGMTPNAAGTACVPIGDTTTTTTTTTDGGLTCGVGMKPNADGTACVPDSTLTTLSTITGGKGDDVIQDDGTTTGILNTIAALNGTNGTSTVSTNNVASDDGTTESILNTIAALNGTNGTSTATDTSGTTGTVGSTGNTTAADDGTTDSILNAIASLNGTTSTTSSNGLTGNDAVSGDQSTDSILNTISSLNGTGGNNSVTGATSVDSTTGLDTSGNGAGTGLNSDLDSITDLGNGLYSVANGDGTFNIVTEDGVSMGSVGGGLEAVQDWEGNKTLTGIPNVSVQGGNDDIGAVNDLFYYPEGAEQIERYNNWLNSLKGGDAGASAFMGSTGDIANRYDDGFSAFSGGGGGGGKFFDDNSLSFSAYAKGGRVKTHYNNGGRVKTHFQTGGVNQASNIDQMAENYGVAPQPDIMSYQGSKLFPMQAPAPVSDQMTRRDAYPATPQQPMDARATQLDALLRRYAGDSTDYSSELAEARKRSDAESLAFQKMIQTAIKGSADEAPSKAEMYFRLASAFGSPTRTGHFAEALGNVNKELASYSKEERDAKKAQRALQLQLGLKGQEMRMASAKDELATIKTLAAEGMKDKRAITAEVIKDFIKSGEPESAAGKQAKDEGLKVGTPEFKARVAEIAQTSVDAKLAQVTSTLAGMSVQQANLALAQSKFQNQQAQQAKLSPAEMKLKTDVEDILTSTDQAMLDLKRAYQLNPNTFDTSLADTAQRKLLEAAGSKDPKVIATREQTNLLSKSAVGKLKTAFGGNPTEGERKILLDLEGIDAKSKEERAIIMRNSYTALKNRREREQKRLNDIKQGLYRDTSAPSGELE